MKKILSVILCLLMLPALATFAEAYSFQADLAAVEKTIQSVLMLEVYDTRREMFATGSGFIAFDSGTLVTNYHVMEGAAYIVAVSDGGDRYDVTGVLAADKDLDIAILKFRHPTGMAPLALAENAALRRGEPVVTIGSPEGIKNTVAYGNVSAFVKWDKYTEIQYTAPISHGSSGGVLLNNAGQVIGVVCAFLEGGQNLNYAIDIDFVTDLHKKTGTGTSVPLADYDPSAGESAANHVPALEASQGAAISGLTATQTGPNTVALSWLEREAGTFTYYVTYEIDGNSYYSYDSTGDTSYVIDGLVPGSPYTFFVSTKGEGLDNAELEQSLTVSNYGDYTLRGFQANAFDIYFCDAGADFETAVSIKTVEIPLADTAGTGRLQDHYVELSSRLDASSAVSQGNALYVLSLPSGSVYYGKYRYEYPETASETFVRYINIDWFFNDIREFEGNVPEGEYTLALYYDGLTAARTVFAVTDGGNTGPIVTAVPDLLPPVSVTAFADGMAVQLYWTQVAGALKYNLYRAPSADGTYAAIGTAVSGHYTDLSVDMENTYFYCIESVGEQDISGRSIPVQVSMPAATATPSPAPTPQPTTTPPAATAVYPLMVGEDAYVGTSDDPFINPKIVNISDKTVDGFTLSYYCTDVNGNYIYFNNTTGYYSEYTYTVVIGPDDSAYPGKVSMNLYGNAVRYVYLAISSIHTTDGVTITIPDPDYFYWELD